MSFFDKIGESKVFTIFVVTVFIMVVLGVFTLMVNAELKEVKKENKSKYERVESIKITDVYGDTIIVNGQNLYKQK